MARIHRGIIQKKILMTRITMMMWSPKARHPGVWSKVVLRKYYMNKSSGGDGILAKLFQILKNDAVKVLQSICQQIWKTSNGYRTGKGQFSFQSQRMAMPKNVQITLQLLSFHILVRRRSKSFKLDFSSMWTENFQMYKIDLEKTEEIENKLQRSTGSWKKQRI